MDEATIALIIVATIFGIYSVFASIECGLSILRFWPKLAVNPTKSLGLFVSIWEVTNVFLVMGFTAFAILFNTVSVGILPTIAPAIALGASFLLIRGLLVLLLFYRKSKVGASIGNLLFAATSFGVPLSFASVGIFMLTGHQFWQSFTSVSLLLIAALGLAAMGLAFVRWHEAANKPLVAVSYLIAAFWLTLLMVLPTISKIDQPHLDFAASALLLPLLAISGGLAIITTKPRHRAKLLWIITLCVGAITPLVLATANMPFVAYPKFTLATSFTAHGAVGTLMIGSLITLPVFAIGFWMLYKLLFKKV